MTIEEYNYKMDRDNKVHSSITVIFCLFTVTYTHILFLACLTVIFLSVYCNLHPYSVSGLSYCDFLSVYCNLHPYSVSGLSYCDFFVCLL
jgi:hypothetical protein